MVTKTKAIVLLSGGLDSAVALFWARKNGWQIQGLSFDYFRRSQKEIAAAKKLASYANCPLRIVDVSFLKEVEELRKISSNRFLKSAPSAYIPSRNVVFYGIASSLAEVSNSRYVVGGHNSDDAHSFPDSSPSFFRAFNETTKRGLFSHGRTGRVVLPLAQKSKSEVVLLGGKMKVPFELTWSCYREGKRPCGVCPACELRASAFRKAKLSDPLIRR